MTPQSDVVLVFVPQSVFRDASGLSRRSLPSSLFPKLSLFDCGARTIAPGEEIEQSLLSSMQTATEWTAAV